MRKVHLADGTEWSYTVGKQYVKIRGPNKTQAVSITEMTGRSDRDQEEEPIPVTPGFVKEYILNHLVTP